MKLVRYLVWEGGIWNYGTACLIIAEHKNCKIESSCCVVFQEWSVPDFRERRVWTGWKINREEYRSDNSSARFRRQGVRGVYSSSTVCVHDCITTGSGEYHCLIFLQFYWSFESCAQIIIAYSNNVSSYRVMRLNLVVLQPKNWPVISPAKISVLTWWKLIP